ncbi:MAG: MmcQ/YjbR family DNA-binding protein [Phenylobacterium sp.]|uniref:MmcQ/YjbR family DNA-binding protein n=1 Tax=Phenylobacterium sp. TaxID=1871053 RepID=UPI0027212FB4|nr:MmcQ/YjbR family DNA-binding protein [Phenylobacterium sp.]MDO9430748.1 MmcQ/YjbR family DNA-binding protein [Phenylobacterium sp.]
MTREEVEATALALPAVTKVVQWGGADVYKVGGKVFAICGLAGGLSFKVTEIGFMVLTDDGPGRQAPYLAKGSWVVVDLEDLQADEVVGWLTTSHELIAGKLTRKLRAELGLA